MIKENAGKKIQRNGEKSPDKGKSEAQINESKNLKKLNYFLIFWNNLSYGYR